MSDTQTSTSRAWFVILIASLFFFYEFIQMNMFNSISQALMHDFHINAEQLGRMSAFYFIANVVFLFPAGIILDRYSTRKIILVSLLICIVGIVAFALATNVIWATLFRFLTGIGSAFCFLSVIRLASRWFAANRMAFVTGIVVTIAMTGGMVAQTPLLLLVQAVDWRTALFIDAGFGLLIFALISGFVQDYPVIYQADHEQQQQLISAIGYWRSLRLAFANRQNWLAGAYTGLMNLPIIVLGGLWGQLYLVSAHDVQRADASVIAMMLFVGTIIGSPLVGWLSDRVGRRKQPMMIGASLALILMLLVIQLSHLQFTALFLLFLLIGVVTSSQIIGYPLVAESAPLTITAMSVSVVNITCQASVAIVQPLFGWLMDYNVHHYGVQRMLHFVKSDFTLAMWIFPLGFILALLATFLIKETFCLRRL